MNPLRIWQGWSQEIGRLVPGLGDSLSQKVVEYRERVGAFRNLDDLRHVHGIGPKTLERIQYTLKTGKTLRN